MSKKKKVSIIASVLTLTAFCSISQSFASDTTKLTTLKNRAESLSDQIDSKLVRIESLASTCSSARIQKWAAGTTTAVAVVGSATASAGLLGMHLGGALLPTSTGSVIGGLIESFVNVGLGGAIGVATGAGVSGYSLYTKAKMSSENFLELSKNMLSSTPRQFERELDENLSTSNDTELDLVETGQKLQIEKSLVRTLARNTLNKIESDSNIFTASWKESEYCEVSVASQMIELSYLEKEKIVTQFMIELTEIK
jgi:hypothetical protein